jgi:hypothetical protein
VFCATDIQKATNTLSHDKLSPITVMAFSIPIVFKKTGTPLEKIVMAILIPIPRNPHTIARGQIPKPFRLYTPALILNPIHSPNVDKIANFKKLIIIPCSALNVL